MTICSLPFGPNHFGSQRLFQKSSLHQVSTSSPFWCASSPPPPSPHTFTSGLLHCNASNLLAICSNSVVNLSFFSLQIKVCHKIFYLVLGSICIWLNNWLCALTCLLVVQRRQWVIWGHTIVVLQRQLLFVFPPSMFQPETFRMGVTCTLLALPSLLLVSEVESNWLHIKYHHIGRYHRISSTYPCQNYFQYHTFRLQEMGGNFQET